VALVRRGRGRCRRAGGGAGGHPLGARPARAADALGPAVRPSVRPGPCSSCMSLWFGIGTWILSCALTTQTTTNTQVPRRPPAVPAVHRARAAGVPARRGGGRGLHQRGARALLRGAGGRAGTAAGGQRGPPPPLAARLPQRAVQRAGELAFAAFVAFDGTQMVLPLPRSSLSDLSPPRTSNIEFRAYRTWPASLSSCTTRRRALLGAWRRRRKSCGR